MASSFDIRSISYILKS